jgi:hypothetical protein
MFLGETMALTRLQRKLHKEAEQIAEMANVDFWNIDKTEKEYRTIALQIAIAHLVRTEVITRYTLLDEILSNYILRYYCKKPRKGPTWILWRQKKFRVFVHFMLDEMYLLKKMQLAHAIRPFPKDVRRTIERVNAIRNAMAHSFFPENRKEHHPVGKVLYDGKDIRTSDGLRQFKDDCHAAYDYIAKRVYRQWR